jgi:hypothetical protein
MVLLAFSFAFGGASRVNALRLALVELAALPLFVMALSQLAGAPDKAARHRLALGLLAATVVVPLLQLIPLPPAIWTRLPGREQLVLALELVQMPQGWIPLSLTPVQTWNAVLALVPPVAVFIAMLLNRDGPLARRAILVLLAFAAINIVTGAIQLATGDRRFYPYESTQTGFITGLFANRNHFATLLLISMPFAAALAGQAAARRPEHLRAWVLILGAVFAVAMLSLLAAQSRAGVILFVPALALSVVVAWRAARLGRPKPLVLIIGGILIAGGLGMGATFLPPVFDRYDAASGQTEARFQRWPTVVSAGQTYLPVGAGVGSFDPVFRTVEPLEQLDRTFFNHAHNEYLEIWIETGWFGVALLALLFVWWGRRSWDAWFRSKESDRSLRRAASVAILLMLAHSTVDYPLRTETLAVMFALAAAILEGGGRLAPGANAGFSRGSRPSEA